MNKKAPSRDELMKSSATELGCPHCPHCRGISSKDQWRERRFKVQVNVSEVFPGGGETALSQTERIIGGFVHPQDISDLSETVIPTGMRWIPIDEHLGLVEVEVEEVIIEDDDVPF